ncbi:hypothetical protein BGZ76_009577, partial [Entomortierella beljakovae]
FYMRRYHSAWHLRFTYVLSASFDTGVAFFGLISFLIFTTRNVGMVEWWGTDVACTAMNMPTIPVPPKAPEPGA